jgi:hypothetical protein
LPEITSGYKYQDEPCIFDDTVTLFEKRELLFIGNSAGNKEIIVHFCLDSIVGLRQIDLFDFNMIGIGVLYRCFFVTNIIGAIKLIFIVVLFAKLADFFGQEMAAVAEVHDPDRRIKVDDTKELVNLFLFKLFHGYSFADMNLPKCIKKI